MDTQADKAGSASQKLKNIFESHEENFWNDLPEYVKKGIARSKQQAYAGLLTPHDEVMKKYAKYL